LYNSHLHNIMPQAEHSYQLASDESTCNVMKPTTLPKESTTQALDLAHSPARDVRTAIPTTSWLDESIYE
jgi:hypothetical protein